MSPMASLASPQPPADNDVSAMGAATSNLPAFGADDVRSLQKRQTESAMDQIRQANTIIDSIAAQFPATSAEVQAAKAAMVKIMTKIVGSQSQPQSQQPTGVMG